LILKPFIILKSFITLITSRLKIKVTWPRSTTRGGGVFFMPSVDDPHYLLMPKSGSVLLSRK